MSWTLKNCSGHSESIIGIDHTFNLSKVFVTATSYNVCRIKYNDRSFFLSESLPGQSFVWSSPNISNKSSARILFPDSDVLIFSINYVLNLPWRFWHSKAIFLIHVQMFMHSHGFSYTASLKIGLVCLYGSLRLLFPCGWSICNDPPPVFYNSNLFDKTELTGCLIVNTFLKHFISFKLCVISVEWK